MCAIIFNVILDLSIARQTSEKHPMPTPPPHIMNHNSYLQKYSHLFLIFHLNIYSSLPHHPLKTFPPPLPLQTWRPPLLNQRRQGWAFSVMQRNIPLLNVCQLLQRIPGPASPTQCRVAAVKSDSSTAIRL